MINYIVGFDPGSPLYLSLYSFGAAQLITVTDPTIISFQDKNHAWNNDPTMIVRLLNAWFPSGMRGVEIVGEAASMRRGEGVTSGTKYVGSMYMMKGIAAGLHIPYHEVPAAKWKRDLKLSDDKNKSRQMAIQLWPAKAHLFRYVKDHNKAEAALIAQHRALQLRGEL